MKKLFIELMITEMDRRIEDISTNIHFGRVSVEKGLEEIKVLNKKKIEYQGN